MHNQATCRDWRENGCAFPVCTCFDSDQPEEETTRITQLEADRDRLARAVKDWQSIATDHADENGRLRKALRFYSDGFAYLTPEGWKRIWRDGGQTARTALETDENCNNEEGDDAR